MHLTPGEQERLMTHCAGELAKNLTMGHLDNPVVKEALKKLKS